jgi:hypothetical protein
MKHYLIFSIILLFCLSSCSKKSVPSPTNPPTPVPLPPVATTYQLVWADEFEKEGLPDTTKWGYDVGGGGWGNNELEYYTKSKTKMPELKRVI